MNVDVFSQSFTSSSRRSVGAPPNASLKRQKSFRCVALIVTIAVLAGAVMAMVMIGSRSNPYVVVDAPSAKYRSAGDKVRFEVNETVELVLVGTVGALVHIDARRMPPYSPNASYLLGNSGFVDAAARNVSHLHPLYEGGGVSASSRLFCPQSDVEKLLMRRPGPGSVSGSVILRLRECPEPVLLHKVPSGPLLRRFNRLSLYPCLAAREIFSLRLASRAAGGGGKISEVDEGTAIAQCSQECLAHPCCIAFQLDRHDQSSSWSCRLLKCRFDLTGHWTAADHDVLSQFQGFTYFMGHLRDVRAAATAPLLLPPFTNAGKSGHPAQHHLRLVVISSSPEIAAGRVVRLDEHHEWASSMFTLQLEDTSNAYGGENSLMFPRVLADAAVTASLYKLRGFPGEDLENHSPPESKPLFQSTSLMIRGRAVFPSVVPSFTSLHDRIGEWIELQFEAHVPNPSPTSTTTIVRVAARPITYFIQRRSPSPKTQRRLLFVKPRSRSRDAGDDESILPSMWQRPSQQTTSGVECGINLLRSRDECCLHGVVSVHIHPDYDDMHVSSANFISRRVYLTLDSLHPCVQLVDGWYSRYNEFGVADFTHLVVKRLCSKDALRSAGPIVLALHDRADGEELEAPFRGPAGGMGNGSRMAPVANVTISPLVLLSCGNDDDDEASSTAAARHSKEGLQENHGTPVLFSIAVHECLSCIDDLLKSLAAFASPCLVVLHISESWNITVADRQALAAMSGGPSYPKHLFINDHVVQDTYQFFHRAHFSNVAFMLRTHHADRGVPWSHVAFLASNELFVRRGAVEYMRRFDLSRVIPSPLGGMTFDHHSERTFVSLPKGEFLWKASPTIQAAFQQPMIASYVRQKGITKIPSEFIVFEGTFLSFSVAKEVVESFGSWAPENFCVDGRMTLSPSEGHVQAVLHAFCERPEVKCGERLSTLLLANYHSAATVEDVWRVRCSPFDVPFSFKKIERSNQGEPIRQLVRRIIANESQRWALRSFDTVHCPFTFSRGQA